MILGGDDVPLGFQGVTRFDVPLLWDSIPWNPLYADLYEWPMNGSASIAKVLGGCGVHNGMLYLRGVPEDMEEWGIDGWDWETVLQYYIKSENNADFGGNTSVHGDSGPMGVTKVDSIDPMAALFYEVAQP